MTIKSITSGQAGQLRQFAENASRKAVDFALAKSGVGKSGSQRIIEVNGAKFTSRINEFVLDLVLELSVSDNFKDEEVPSSWDYPKGFRPKSIESQVGILHQFFPGVGVAGVEFAKNPLHNGQSYFAIPKWKTIGDTYDQALTSVLNAISKQRSFYNYCEGAIGADRLILSKRTVQFWDEIAREQNNYDVMVIPAQFGRFHRGRSIRRAVEVMLDEEFGLDPLSVAIMILTHPERFGKYDDLCVDCSGCEYDFPESTTSWSSSLSFSFGDDKLVLSSRPIIRAREDYGTVSGFFAG